MQVRRCWPALLLKANQALEIAAGEMACARDRVMTLAQQRERVARMLEEYAERHGTLTRGDHYVSESLGIQRFMSQLQLMLDRIDAEAANAEKTCCTAAATLNAAQAQVNKFGKLIELETAALQVSTARSEARSLDEIALLRFRLRER